MSKLQPHLVLLAGPNGSGKTTIAPKLLKGKLGVSEFVNADLIAGGLSVFDPELAAMSAGRVMLARLKELAARRTDFAFETTLASRSFAPWIAELMDSGYRFHLLFLWLASDDLAVARVADRVRMGGHSVPEATIRRRYRAGLRNFFTLYQPLATTWEMVDNSYVRVSRLIARGRGNVTDLVGNSKIWNRIQEEYRNGK
ncbi:MAG: zeta toxin family protein [Thermoguttaceae bacterium]